ncbi:MAG TPA: hypothetical protein VN048_03860 [Verrucomicrobiae bacterium]|nr:hypothetical protein [Verrucomicrobiae bacterium]
MRRRGPAQFRWPLVLLVVTILSRGQAQSVDAPAATNSNLVRIIHGDILAFHLSTNAAGYARGLAGSSDDMFALSGWRYSTYDATNIGLLTNATWSKTFWLAGVRGLSATCLGYSNGMGGQGLVTMVSPRHYLFATHMHPEGYLAAFLDTNDVIQWRTTLERVDVTNDISVGILNADLPPSVGFMPILPSDFARYLPTNNVALLQGIGMNQSWRVFSQPMTFMFPGFVAWDSRGAAPFGLGTNWNMAIRAGDSSDPEMLLIGRQLVLAAHTSSIQFGANYACYIDAINEQMHHLSIRYHTGTDYKLTTFSLTNWPVVNH